MQNAMNIDTTKRYQLADITTEVKNAVAQSGISDGLCVVYTKEVSAAIVVSSPQDEKIHEDIMDDMERIFPARDNFHFSGAVGQGAAHGKSAVCGTSRDFIIADGQLALGNCEGIYLAEFAGPAKREYAIKLLGKKEAVR